MAVEYSDGWIGVKIRIAPAKRFQLRDRGPVSPREPNQKPVGWSGQRSATSLSSSLTAR